ncbi:alpha/beta hydrolase [Salibacterium sp. K-3]
MLFVQKTQKLHFIKGLILALCFSFFIQAAQQGNAEQAEESPPALVIHNIPWGPPSFHPILESRPSLSGQSSGLIFYISSSGGIHTAENPGKKDPLPFIHVIFEQQEMSLDEQTIWLQHIVRVLRDDYHIHRVNLAGTSPGNTP